MLFYILIAYLVGAIPSGYWFAKFFYGIDVTKHGSRNIGATNVARVLGSKKFFFLIFFFDFCKAFLVAYFAPGDVVPWCAVALVVGNGYSIFMRFRGGKGVATMLGTVAMYPLSLVGFVIVWGATLWWWRRVDVASLLATASLLFFFPLKWLSGFFIVWILLRHRSNIKEILL